MNHKKFARITPRRVLSASLGRLFYQDRVDKDGNVTPPRPVLAELNRRLVERGFSPPWTMTKQECQDFWASRKNDEQSLGNRPVDYAIKDTGIINFLHSFWTPEVGPDKTILELGCNCGSNLNALYKLGYHNLSGIEINESAIDEMQRRFPDLTRIATVSRGSVEDLLPRIPSKSVDVVFTMAVLMHVHPASTHVFSEMVRVAREYVVVIELETANCGYVFARNYRRVFQRLGCSESKSVLLTKHAFPAVSRDYDGCTARVFAVPRR